MRRRRHLIRLRGRLPAAGLARRTGTGGVTPAARDGTRTRSSGLAAGARAGPVREGARGSAPERRPVRSVRTAVQRARDGIHAALTGCLPGHRDRCRTARARPAPIGLALAVAWCALSAPPPAVAAETAGGSAPATLDDVERRIDETAARLDALDAEIDATRTERQTLAAALADAESRVGERRARIRGLEADIARFEARVAELEGAVARERAGLGGHRARLAASLRGAQRLGSVSGLRLALGHDDPALAARLGVYADYLLAAQRAALETQTETLARIERAHATALEDRAWLEHIKRKASGQRDARLAERAARAARLAAVDEDLGARLRSVAELEADRERLGALLEELRALQSGGSGHFAAGKGRYRPPVEGELVARFGEVKSVGKLRWNGLFVGAPRGTAVRTVAAGEIVYADRLRGFGLLVIVDHGDGFMTLYGGNRDVTVSPGDWVESGATIATVGESAGQSDSGVYFEIRENARPIDPEPWLAS